MKDKLFSQTADHQIRHKVQRQLVWWLHLAILIFLQGFVWTHMDTHVHVHGNMFIFMYTWVFATYWYIFNHLGTIEDDIALKFYFSHNHWRSIEKFTNSDKVLTLWYVKMAIMMMCIYMCMRMWIVLNDFVYYHICQVQWRIIACESSEYRHIVHDDGFVWLMFVARVNKH